MDYASLEASAWLARCLKVEDVTRSCAIVPRADNVFDVQARIPNLDPVTDQIFTTNNYEHMYCTYMGVAYATLLCRETNFTEGEYTDVVKRYRKVVSDSATTMAHIRTIVGGNTKESVMERMFYVERALIRKAIPVMECSGTTDWSMTERIRRRGFDVGMEMIIEMSVVEMVFDDFLEELRIRGIRWLEVQQTEHQLSILATLAKEFKIGVGPGEYGITVSGSEQFLSFLSENESPWLDEIKTSSFDPVNLSKRWLYLASPFITVDTTTGKCRYWGIKRDHRARS